MILFRKFPRVHLFNVCSLMSLVIGLQLESACTDPNDELSETSGGRVEGGGGSSGSTGATLEGSETNASTSSASMGSTGQTSESTATTEPSSGDIESGLSSELSTGTSGSEFGTTGTGPTATESSSTDAGDSATDDTSESSDMTESSDSAGETGDTDKPPMVLDPTTFEATYLPTSGLRPTLFGSDPESGTCVALVFQFPGQSDDDRHCADAHDPRFPFPEAVLIWPGPHEPCFNPNISWSSDITVEDIDGCIQFMPDHTSGELELEVDASIELVVSGAGLANQKIIARNQR